MEASPHPRVLERASRPFELVHADHVPLDGISFGGSKYMPLIIDDYTCYAWVYFSHLKDAVTVAPLISAFVRLILTQFNVVIKRWRTDGGTGEFLNSLIVSVYQEFGMIQFVLKLRRSLYGLKKAPRISFSNLNDIFFDKKRVTSLIEETRR
jgi:hypothetical protein